MVEVPTTIEFEQLKLRVNILEEKMLAVEANMKVMPDPVKAALKTVLDWMNLNV